MIKKLLVSVFVFAGILSIAQNNNSIASFTASFNKLSSCMNVFSVLNSNSKVLNYNRFANAVSFIQRKSVTYMASPSGDSNSGTIVAYIGANMGTQWDSTVVWANSTNLARYPQGGIYNPNNQGNLQNCYVVACGPAMNGANWAGNWYASKSLTATAVKNMAGPDQQFFGNTGTFSTTTSPNMIKHDYSRNSFVSTDDGIVRSAGELYDDVNSTTLATQKFRGSMISKGSFNAGAFVWTPDSFIAPCVTRSDGSKQLHQKCWMTFNDGGTVGYLVMIGSRTGQTSSNKGWQPIIYKTTNAGNTWTLINGIDFNSGNFNALLNSLAPVNTNSTLTIPYFNVEEGIDISIDKNGKLHIFSSIVSTSSNHNDSLDRVWTYTVNGTPNVYYKFTPGKMPYLIDFIGDGASNWSYKIVDSVGTQARLGVSSYTAYPWSGSVSPFPGPSGPAGPESSKMRLNLSRSYDGEFILYSWTESDTLLTTGASKWNEFPNIKTRALRIMDNTISNNKYSITSTLLGNFMRVRDKAYFYYVSPQLNKMCLTPAWVSFTVPYTVSNNADTDPDAPIDNFYSNVVMQYTFANVFNGCTINVKELSSNKIDFDVFPNPASQYVQVKVNLENAKDVEISMFNALGQTMMYKTHKGNSGENYIDLNLNTIAPGIYLVKIKCGNDENVKKLIVE